MIAAVLIAVAVVLLVVLEAVDRRATQELRTQIAADIDARLAAGVPNVPTAEERAQPFSPEVMRAARPWGPGFPRWIIAGGVLLVVAFLAERVNGLRPWADGGENSTIAGPVAVALVLGAALRERWAAALVVAVGLAGIATLVDLHAHEPYVLTVDEAIARGGGRVVEPTYTPRTAAALWIGWIVLAAVAGWAAWQSLYAAPDPIRQRLWTAVAALPLLLIAGYWFSEGEVAGIVASLIAWLWADLARRALLAYWAWDLLRKAGWTGLAGERPGEIVPAPPGPEPVEPAAP